jgi:hypothetical protein
MALATTLTENRRSSHNKAIGCTTYQAGLQPLTHLGARNSSEPRRSHKPMKKEGAFCPL